ncbi:Bug family tripartite tricarboxylate transporter substrate binding protein [Oceaniglobus roseus]|uniref:Bug family tripartite tricarboxylate transporter substrate binding protein n=1 Tax=Oceaniglobus roseus TaxID=1737570 RepID=UPI000C7E9792|nr:tripartite tricarboxylate transporter substrate binding protein [Kandeliimicrobium roseum]
MLFEMGRRAVLGGIAALSLMPGLATAQDTYEPGRLTIVVPFNPGGSADRMARAIAQFLPEELGVPVTVMNQPGGSGALGHTYFLQQPDDGSFALVSPVNPYLISNILRGQGMLEWDKFHFVNGQWQDYYVVLVNKDQPFQTGKELIDFIKENPGEASSAIINGDGGHLATVVMLERLGLPKDAVNFISYDGGAPMRTALAGNQVTFSVISALGSSVIADDVRPLAVIKKEPDDLWDAPNINDILAEYGVEIPLLAADLRTFTVHQSFVDKHPETYQKLVDAYRRMLERDDFKAFIEEGQIGGQWMGPEATAESLNESYEIFAKYIDVLE